MYPDFRETISFGKNMTGDENRDYAEMMYHMAKKAIDIVDLIYEEVRHETYDYVIFDHHFLAEKSLPKSLGFRASHCARRSRSIKTWEDRFKISRVTWKAHLILKNSNGWLQN
ncbi:hypothetical protein QKW52_05470 [Bacillus sonorensis]|nr:hypothetical protein [Bacillus sonorensis]